MAAEPGLVRDVISACQGISSSSVAVGTDAGGDLTFNVAKSLSRPQRQLILRLCEFGWLFRKAQAFARQGQGARGAAGGGGAVAQAFRCALQGRLAQQFQLFALLEKQLQHPLPSGQARGGEEGSSGDEKPYLTLLRLALWLEQPTLLLRWMCLLAHAVSDLEGGQLLRVLHAHSRHGEAFVAQLAEELVEEAAAPLLDTLRGWLAGGRLAEGAATDFFINEQPGGWRWSQQPALEQGTRLARHNAWQERYVVDRRQLPHFINEALAADILRTGKSIAFLREGCGDHDFEAGTAVSALWPRDHSALLQGRALETAVCAEAARVDRYLLATVIGRGGAMLHAAAMKSFLLATAGDFVWALLDALDPLLDQLASDTSEYAMNAEVEVAIRGSSARLAGDDVLGRLRVRLFPGGSLDSAWDVFALEYDLTEPLATVFTPTAVATCNRISRFVWSLARCSRQLSATWVSLLRAQRHVTAIAAAQRRLGLEGKPPLGEARAALTALHCSRAAIAAFFATLQDYVNREVIASAWDTFEGEVAAASNLDDVIVSHSSYLDRVQRRLLLAPPAVPLLPSKGEEAQASLRATMAAAAVVACQAGQLEREAATAKDSIAALERLAVRRRKTGDWAVQPTDTCLGLEGDICREIQEATADAAAAFQDARSSAAAALEWQCQGEGLGMLFA